MEEDIYKDAKSAVEATEKAKRYNDDRTALEILNDLLLKSRMLGADNVRINDEFKEESGFDFARIDDILLKAKYSGRDIETDDYNIVRDYYVAVKNKADKSRSMPKRLLWRLIYVI